jgi:hypothetical protein
MGEIINHADPFWIAVIFGIFGAFIRLAVKVNQAHNDDLNRWKIVNIIEYLFKFVITLLIIPCIGIIVWLANSVSETNIGLAFVSTTVGFGGLESALLLINVEHQHSQQVKDAEALAIQDKKLASIIEAGHYPSDEIRE